ncbi:MAG TPA: hypothetical protein VF832_14010, partial [Longimicrobiales bacterium]
MKCSRLSIARWCAALAFVLATGARAQEAAATKAAVAASPAFAASPADSDVARVILLGTGTPILTPEHSGNSVAVLVRGSLYVFDAGPGVVNRMLQAAAKGVH